MPIISPNRLFLIVVLGVLLIPESSQIESEIRLLNNY